jgi:hypothetical protein
MTARRSQERKNLAKRSKLAIRLLRLIFLPEKKQRKKRIKKSLARRKKAHPRKRIASTSELLRLSHPLPPSRAVQPQQLQSHKPAQLLRANPRRKILLLPRGIRVRVPLQSEQLLLRVHSRKVMHPRRSARKSLDAPQKRAKKIKQLLRKRVRTRYLERAFLLSNRLIPFRRKN